MFDQNQPAQSAQVVPEPITTSDSAAASTADTTTYNTTPVTPEPVTETTASTSSEMPVASETQTIAEPAAETTVPETPAADDNLLTIKKDALQNLTPLLSQLEQTPEEKFRTTMMLIQASDDKSLIQSAYDAAKDIEDEKVRAQALLDIVNEINYFTQDKEDK